MPAERRLVLVLAAHHAGPAAPAVVDPGVLARATLADGYETVADLAGVGHGIVGDGGVEELLWPGGLRLETAGPSALAARLTGTVDELVLVAADVPDLPGLVLAKVLKVLHRSDAVVAPDLAGRPVAVALGLRLPLAGWLADLDPTALDLDGDLAAVLAAAAPRRSCVARSPGWRRLRTPADLASLDPGLEGWDETRLVLADAGVASAQW